MKDIECEYCSKKFTKYGIKNHISLVHTKTRDICRAATKNKGRSTWNKGLTKETDERVLKNSISTSKSLMGKPGHKHTTSYKEFMRKVAIKNNLGGHTSKKSIKYKKGKKEIYLHSDWERIVAEDLDKNNISWERPNPINWKDIKGIEHKYYADFYLNDYNIYLDPKNSYLQEKDKIKIKTVTEQNNIKVLILSENELLWKVILNKINADVTQR